MDTPTVALRFRDTTSGVDTIDAHRSIIARNGEVWWGWWKKDFEENHENYLNRFFVSTPNQSPILSVLIVDRATKRMFSAVAKRWTRYLNEAEAKCVPEYYRHELEKVFGWFLISSIEPTEYSYDIASQFGDNTFLKVSYQNVMKQGSEQKTSEPVDAREKSCLLYLSDLHFGDDYAFRPQISSSQIGNPRKTLSQCLEADLNRITLKDKIGGLVITGDFTTRGDWSDATKTQILAEFEELRKILGLEKQQIFAVPGNHDIVRYPTGSKIDAAQISVENQTTYRHEIEFRTFVDLLVARDWKRSLNYIQKISLKNADVYMCILNSCTITATEWTEYGLVGQSGLDALSALEAAKLDRPTFKFAALHHHLLPVAAVEAPKSQGVTLSLDAAQLLDAAQRVGVGVAIHGHQHTPKIMEYKTIPLQGESPTDKLIVVSNGSSGVSASRRPENERNTYCLFEIDASNVRLVMRELRTDGNAGATLYDGRLDVSAKVS